MNKINKVKQKLIFLDLDGTVLKEDRKSIHPTTKKAIQNAVAKGHIVCIITGRKTKYTIDIYNKLQLNTLLITMDGAHISDPIKKEFKRLILPINKTVVDSILQEPILKGKVENIIIEYYNDSMSQLPNTTTFTFNNDQIPFGNISTDWDGPCNNLILKLKSKYECKIVAKYLSRKYKNSISIKTDLIYGVIDEDNEPLIIIKNKFATKAFAASMVAQYYNISLEDAIAFGDQMNDYEMLKIVGLGIAMKNGNKKLKNIADLITDYTNDEGGVGETLKSIV